ncbi:MAG: helix-turn-helix transcriptional regulator [Microbacteriaceae bacterium]|nr:helix-turn-helix transcriptional regulator [Microbacteriaceae bacterium]
MHVDDTERLIAVIADAVESRLRVEQNPIVADPVARDELRGQIGRLVGRVLARLGVDGDAPRPEHEEHEAPIGTRRARQGIHPSASLAAADALFDVALPELVAAAPLAEQFAVARALNATLRSEVTRASTDYVDALVGRLEPRADPTPTGPRLPPLTARELEVLRLIAQARSNQQIAVELSITEGTVKRHAGSIYDKLGARSRLDAVRIATAAGIL